MKDVVIDCKDIARCAYFEKEKFFVESYHLTNNSRGGAKEEIFFKFLDFLRGVHTFHVECHMGLCSFTENSWEGGADSVSLETAFIKGGHN